jgi:hypothetical protein
LAIGGCYMHHADAFLMIRGGHLEVSLLGAFEVSEAGDLANWATDDPTFPPGVDGAMDLAVGAREVRVLMDHVGKNGEPRIRHRCTLPLTAPCVVKRRYTNSAVIDVQPNGLLVREIVGEISNVELQSLTEPKLQFSTNLQILAPPLRPEPGQAASRSRAVQSIMMQYSIGEISIIQVIEQRGAGFTPEVLFPDWGPAILEQQRALMVPACFD